MLTYTQALILGIIQGLTELFPISSLGHSVILPALLGWNVNQNANSFLIFLVATHLGTSLVLFGFFVKDWILILKGIARSLRERNIDEHDTYAKLGWLLVVATIPAGILGLLFEQKLQLLFATPLYVSLFLFLNGLLLFGAEYIQKKDVKKHISDTEAHTDKNISKISWVQSVKVGFAQALALLPGFSRTGSTIGGSLLVGLDHEAAARFSFLLATPIIFAAGILKLPELITPETHNLLGPLLLGAAAAACAAYGSVKFLTQYFKSKTLTPFALYCTLAGILSFAFFLIR